MSNQNPAAKFITTHRRKSAANNKPDENQIPPTKIRPLLRLSEPPENASQEQFEIYLRNLENWFERIRNHAQPGGNDRDIVSILHLFISQFPPVDAEMVCGEFRPKNTI